MAVPVAVDVNTAAHLVAKISVFFAGYHDHLLLLRLRRVVCASPRASRERDADDVADPVCEQGSSCRQSSTA